MFIPHLIQSAKDRLFIPRYLTAVVAVAGILLSYDCAAVEGKFVPTDERRLLIIGQDLDSIEAYTGSGFFPEPGGVTNYTNIYDMTGVTEARRYGSGTMFLQQAAEEYPNSAIAIGLYIGEVAPYETVNGITAANGLRELFIGVYDDNLQILADFAQSISPQPVFLRIGYEFDGPWNAHDPAKYIVAFRYIVDFMRDEGITNMAFVWQSATWGENPLGQMLNFYPGDDYVDWVGFTFFLFDEDFNEGQFEEILSIARDKNKPVMMAETSAQFYDFTTGNKYDSKGNAVKSLGDAGIRDEFFFDQLFRFIDDNDDIRAVAWINANWREQDQWRCCENGFWGDTRIEETQFIRDAWLEEILNGRWVHGSPDLLEDLAITENQESTTSAETEEDSSTTDDEEAASTATEDEEAASTATEEGETAAQ